MSSDVLLSLVSQCLQHLHQLMTEEAVCAVIVAAWVPDRVDRHRERLEKRHGENLQIKRLFR